MLRLQDHVSLHDLCKDILKTDSKVTFAVMINEKGRIEESQVNDNVIKKLPAIRQEMLFMEHALGNRMQKEFDEELGEVAFTHVQRQKRILLSFPMENNLLLVFLNRGTDCSLLTKKINRLIHSHMKKSSLES